MSFQIVEKARNTLKTWRAVNRRQAINTLKHAKHPRIHSLLMGVWQRDTEYWPFVSTGEHLSQLKKKQRLVLDELPKDREVSV